MAEKPIIMLVDSNRSNLEQLSQYLEREGLATVAVSSREEFDQAVQDKQKFDLALIDLSGFDRSIWDSCEELGRLKIPFMVISPQRSPMVQQDSVKHGARGVLVKPIGIKELMEYVRTLLAK
jgi:DNA-binding response OmpR family regulator